MVTQRRPRRWLWPVVTVVVLVGIGVLAAWAGWLTPGQAGPGASPSPSRTTATPPRPDGGYDVAAGEGGTALAADGVTHVGYDGSCKGAVQAATNYDTFLNEGMATERWTPESFQAVLNQIVGFDGDDPTGLRTRLVGEREQTRQLMMDTVGVLALPSIGFAHPERGGYLVRACSAEGQAVVDIVSYWDEPSDGAAITVTQPDGSDVDISGGPIEHRISVSWFKGDWRLIDWEVIPDSPADDGNPGGPSWTNPSAEYRRAWMNNSGDPWMEYTNAPR